MPVGMGEVEEKTPDFGNQIQDAGDPLCGPVGKGENGPGVSITKDRRDGEENGWTACVILREVYMS